MNENLSTTRSPLSRWDVLVDRLEKLVLLSFFGWFVVRIVSAYLVTAAPANLILLSSEGLVVWLVLIRRGGREISHRPTDWLLAFSATIAPLLAQPSLGKALLPETLGATLMMIGLLAQIHAKIVLGRSFGCVPANRGLKLSGPYRFVRHPIYAGYMITHLAFLLMNPTIWNLGIYGLCYSLQIPRLLAEERLLSHDPQYQDYMKHVRYRLVPGLF